MTSGNSESDGLYNTQDAADIVTRLTHTTETRYEVDAEWVRVAVSGKRYQTTKGSKRYAYQCVPLLKENRDYIRKGRKIYLTVEGIDRMVRKRSEQLSAFRAGRKPSRGRYRRVQDGDE